jgi:arylsulfatase A-like enzyme
LVVLEVRGILDESWLVITSDHGEAFGEHGATEHGTTVHAEVTRIPLLILPPKGVELPAEDGAAGLLDVATTLAAVGGAPGFGVGGDLRTPAPDRVVQVEFFGDARKVPNHGPLAGEPARAVVREGWRLVEHDGRRELYRVDRDPAEREDLAEREPARVEALAELLPPLEDPTRRAPARELRLSPAEREQLRILGYIE